MSAFLGSPATRIGLVAAERSEFLSEQIDMSKRDNDIIMTNLMRQQQGIATAQIKLKTLNDNPYLQVPATAENKGKKRKFVL